MFCLGLFDLKHFQTNILFFNVFFNNFVNIIYSWIYYFYFLELFDYIDLNSDSIRNFNRIKKSDAYVSEKVIKGNAIFRLKRILVLNNIFISILIIKCISYIRKLRVDIIVKHKTQLKY